ncbi:phosphonate ABC transporter, permease protein PhnE [Nesterenkonia suensis]
MSVMETARPRVLRPPKDKKRRRLQLVALVVVALFGVALWQTGFTPWNVWGRMDSVVNLIDRMMPPSFVDWQRYVVAVIETLWMVLAGTAIALVLAVPVSALAARNITTGPVAYNVCRFIITLTRAVPSLVFALIFVRAIGVGPTAGVLAMGISSIGMIGKFFADRIEEIDMGIVEASRASGATRIQTFFSAVLPQVMTNWISLSLYRIDINLRNAVILGFVGAGGIGLELQRVQGQMVYTRVMAIAIIIFLLVLLTERLSAMARAAVLGSEAPAKDNPFSLRAKYKAFRSRRVEQSAARAGEGGTAGTPTSTATPTSKSTPKPTAATGRRAAWRRPSAEGRISVGWDPFRLRRWTMGWTAVALTVFSFIMLGFGPVQLVVAIQDIIPYVVSMFPPDFVTNFARHLDLMLETIWMALAATVLGLIISLPIGILGAKNATFHPIAEKLARFSTIVVRGMPELIIAVLLVVAFGMGPLAGVLALTIGSIGLAGKLIADTIEDTDLSKQNEAMRAVGAGWLQRTVTSTIPSTLPGIIGVGLYMFDVFVRAATVMGIVGAGGIGLALDASIRGRQMDQTLALIIMIFITVYATEKFSGWLRRQIL